MSYSERYLVLRVPNVGPKALAGPPNDFASIEEARDRIREIEAGHLKQHHTHLEIARYSGDKAGFLQKNGILF